jgi:MFS family permease
MRAGLRFAWASRDLRRILFRASLFFFFANVAWALLPMVARDVLGGSAGFYGAMLGAIGAGAVLGAMVMPPLRKKLSADGLVLTASLMIAGILAAISFKPPQIAGIVLALFLGAAWIAVLTTLNAMAQGVLPNWVRGRGLAIYLMAFNGATTAGSLCWGAVGERIGVPSTLLVGGALLVIAALVAHRYKLPTADADLTPSNHWPEPAIAEQVDHDRGPVLVTVEYKVKAQDRSGFFDSLTLLSQERRRDGAYAWGMTEDTADSERILEWFFVESWAEHLRQHRRVSVADADLQSEVVKFHSGAQPPKVAHYVALEKPMMQTGPLDT